MKYQIKDLKKALILLVVICSVASCGKEEVYSCDPEANMWVKSNLTEIQEMSRVDYIAIGDIVYQKAAYIAFTPSQKQALWIGKMEEVLKLDWTEQESQHIQSMLDLIKVNSFAFSIDRDPEAFDRLEVELYKWIEYAKEELGWDKKLLYSLVVTPLAMNEKKEIIGINSNPKPRTTTSLKRGNEACNPEIYGTDYIWCECSTSSDWCVSTRNCKANNDCKTTGGCGTIGWYDCNGCCKPK